MIQQGQVLILERLGSLPGRCFFLDGNFSISPVRLPKQRTRLACTRRRERRVTVPLFFGYLIGYDEGDVVLLASK